jgi:acyl carrier protein
MTRDEFVDEFAKLLDLPPEEIKPETELSSIETWDSVAYLATLVLIDENLGIRLRPEAISEAVRFEDILKVVESAFE